MRLFERLADIDADIKMFSEADVSADRLAQLNEDWPKRSIDVTDENGEMLPDDVSAERLAKVTGMTVAELKRLPLWELSRPRARERAKLRAEGIEDEDEAHRLMAEARKSKMRKLPKKAVREF